MRVTAAVTIFMAGSAAAFAPIQRNRIQQTSLEATSTRNEFLAQFAGAVMATAAFPGVASAAKYGAIGAGPSGEVDPKDAIIDDEIFASSAVQNALSSVKGYSDLVGQMKDALAKNDQVNLGPVIRKEFDFVKLRSDLNTLNSAFDEDTQRGTDKIVRGILQDLTELETANSQKEGIERSPRRVSNMNAKLDKLQSAFNKFLAFSA